MKNRDFNRLKALVYVLMGVFILGLQPGAARALTPVQVRTSGTNIVSPDGTVYMITSDGQRRPYTSAGAFLSYGFNSWSGTYSATSEELALPVGSFIPPQDGKIICSDRGGDKGTCYLVTNGQKAGFTSADVFTKQGYSFKNVAYGDVSFLPSASHISDSVQSHSPGTFVKKGQTVYLICPRGVVALPSPTILSSWGYSFNDVVSANPADGSLPEEGSLTQRPSSDLSPIMRCGPVPPKTGITVFSPQGGETWTQGTTQTIKWQDNLNYPVINCIMAPCTQPLQTYDIKLIGYSAPCPPNSACPLFMIAPYTVAKNVSGSSYSWSVGKYLDVYGTGSGGTVADGAYTIQVCRSGTDVCGSSYPYFKITSEVSNGITIISPAAEEKWAQGSTQTIRWSAPASIPTVNISITGVYNCPTDLVCPAIMPAPITIANNVPNTGAYSWTIPNCSASSPCSSNFQIPAGTYYLNIMGIKEGDMGIYSSRLFYVTAAGSSNNQAPVISSVGGPVSLGQNQVGSWTIKAYDPDGSYLTYSVDWGETNSAGQGTLSPSPAPTPPIQTSTFTHVYSQSGNYKVTFTVTDALGLTAQSSLTVVVGQSSTTDSVIKIISPTSGQQWAIGSTQTIKWNFNSLLDSKYKLDISLVGGPAGGYVTLISDPYNVSSYTWKVPEFIAAGDTSHVLQPGQYNLKLTLFEGYDACRYLCTGEASTYKAIATSTVYINIVK